MRTLLAGEQSLALGGLVDVYVKLEVQNGSGTWIDVGAALGTHWIINATWGEHIDTPVSQATFTLVQQIGAASLAPLMATSVLNVLDDNVTYSPLLDIARLVRASTAVMARGVALDVSKYRRIFDGRIDDVNTPDSAEMMGPITISCSDLGGWLMDLQIETEGTEYGTTPVGTPLETVLQNVINDNIPAGDPAVTVVKVSSSGYAVTAWAQGETKVMDALQTLVLDSTGEDIRYRYDSSHVSQLTWFDPDRDRVTVDGTIGVEQYVARTLSMSLANVRNAIEMPYSDPASGVSGTVIAEDLASISKNRRRYNRIGASAMIGTAAEAQAVVDAVASDLSDAPAEIAADCHYLWFAQLYDRYTFTANNRQFTDDQTLAVSGYQHTVTNGQAGTTLTLAGRVVGAYGQWVRRLAPGSAVDRSLSILRINSKESADGSTRDFTVLVGTRVVTLFVHYRTVAITETEDIYDFSETAALASDPASPLVLTPVARVVTFSITQPVRDYAVAMRLVPVAAGSLQGDSVLVKVDAAPPGVNVVTHATKTGNLARLEIDVEFGPSDGPVSVAVIERVLGVPTTILTTAMSASGTIDWTTNIELDARAIPANADSISWTVELTDVSGAVWTFGPTYALASAVLINAVHSEAAGVGTVTATVTDAGAYLDTTHNDTGIVSQMSWHVTRLGVTTVKASTTVPALGATSGVYTLVETLDPLHPIVVQGFIHYVDGDSESFGQWTMDSEKIADVVNATVATANGVATVTVVWDSDALVGASCARYNVDGGAWVETVTISAAYLSQFTVAQTAAKQTVTLQAKNAVDAGATWGNLTTLEIGVADQAGLLVTVTQTASTGFSDPGAGVNPTVTLTVVVSDPSGHLTGTATVVPTHNGLVSLNNDTLGAPATSFTATLGTTYTFTATLFKALGGGGFAKFVATQGSYIGNGVFWASSAWADMAADVIITVGSNQSSSDVTAKASLVVNTVQNADSMKWLASTSSQPTKADTIATGASVSVGPPFYVADLGVTLALGDSVYVTVVLYDYAGQVMDKSFEAKATRTNLSRSKTIQWAAAAYWKAYAVSRTTDGHWESWITWGPITAQRSLDELFVNIQGPGAGLGSLIDQRAYLTHSFVLADGGTVTAMGAEVWGDDVDHGGGQVTDARVALLLYAVAAGSLVGDAAAIATMTDTTTGGWQTLAASGLSQSTTGMRFVVQVNMTSTERWDTDDIYAKFRTFTVTYLPSNLQSTV